MSRLVGPSSTNAFLAPTVPDPLTPLQNVDKTVNCGAPAPLIITSVFVLHDTISAWMRSYFRGVRGTGYDVSMRQQQVAVYVVRTRSQILALLEKHGTEVVNSGKWFDLKVGPG